VSAGRYGVGRHRSREDAAAAAAAAAAAPPSLPPARSDAPSTSVRERLDIDRRAVRRKYSDRSRAFGLICNFVLKQERALRFALSIPRSSCEFSKFAAFYRSHIFPPTRRVVLAAEVRDATTRN